MRNSRPTRRSVLAAGGFGAAALAGSTLAGCGQITGSADGIQYWAAFPDQATRDYFLQHRAADWDGPVPVRISVKPDDALDRLTQTALAAGSGPDLIASVGPAQVAAYAHAGYLLDLEDYASQFGWADTLAPWAIEASRVDGKLVALPSAYETMCLFFNPATLEQHGWTVPTNRAEFEAICTEAAGAGLTPVGAGNADWRAASEWYVTAALNHVAGPDAIYSALQGETSFTDPVFGDAIEALAGWITKGWWGGGVQNYFTNTFPGIYDDLATGQAVFYVSGSWTTTEIGAYFGDEAGNDATWQWQPIPSLADGVPAEVFDLGIGQSMSINVNTEHPDAAADYLDFLESDPRRQAQGVADVGLQPSPVALSDGDFPAGTDDRLKSLYLRLSNARTIGYTTWTFFPQQTDTYLYTEFDKVITGKLGVSEYLAGLDELFQQEFAAGQVPAAPSPTGEES